MSKQERTIHRQRPVDVNLGGTSRAGSCVGKLPLKISYITHRLRLNRLKRFSLATLLLITTVCAILLWVGKWVTYEPITDRIPAYEKAPSTRGSSFDVGPNRVQMRLVTRNDRDGSLIHEDGRGTVLGNLTPQNAQTLGMAAPWLDVAQIELSPTPDRLDAIEARVFDHQTRMLLSETDPAYGWRMAAPDVLQIYGLGKALPEKLDVWFRISSYSKNEGGIGTFAPTPQAACMLPDGTRFNVNEIRASLEGGWSSAKGFLASPVTDEGEVWMDFTISHPEREMPPLQIVAVLKSGERVHSHGMDYIGRHALATDQRQLVSFHADLSKVKHFEIRPFGGRERFFFEAVTLPTPSNKPFVAPPNARIQIAGSEIDKTIADFAPLDIRVSTHRGEWAGGSRIGSGQVTVTKSAHVTNLDHSLTVVCNSRGVPVRPQLQFVPGKRSPLATSRNRNLSGSQGGGPSGNFAAFYWMYRTPLDQIETVDVSLPTP